MRVAACPSLVIPQYVTPRLWERRQTYNLVVSEDLRDLIRDVPDFPEPGIVFKDITPLLADPGALSKALDAVAAPHLGDGVSHVAGIESRGFVFAPGVAERLGAGFVPLRKAGKLPWATLSRSFELEYGSATIEMHVDAVGEGATVLVVDDVIATGGTAAAAIDLLRSAGAAVTGVSVLVELSFLGARDRLDVPVEAVIVYDD
jgi:adenine phosphoribosyltransferase